VLACLRELPVAKLLTRTGAVTSAAFGGPTLPADPRVAPPARPGRPVLSGHTSDEQRLVSGVYRVLGKPITEAQYPGLLRAGFGTAAGAVAAEYPIAARGSAEAAWTAAYTDSGFVCPQLRTDDRLAAHGPVIGYEFADPTAPPLIPATHGFSPGASHAADLFSLFDIKGWPLHLDGTPATRPSRTWPRPWSARGARSRTPALPARLPRGLVGEGNGPLFTGSPPTPRTPALRTRPPSTIARSGRTSSAELAG
jgi:carboxylesterase type B